MGGFIQAEQGNQRRETLNLNLNHYFVWQVGKLLERNEDNGVKPFRLQYKKIQIILKNCQLQNNFTAMIFSSGVTTGIPKTQAPKQMSDNVKYAAYVHKNQSSKALVAI